MSHQCPFSTLDRMVIARYAYQTADYWRWRVAGGGPTPTRHKASVLAGSASGSRRTFVETGTYRGDMLARLVGVFDQLHSIERDSELYQAAVRRFRDAPSVNIYHGDSAVALSRILAHVSGQCVFWLDAHPAQEEQGDLTLLAELRAVLAHPGGEHRVVVDDIRCFSGERGWPSLTDVVMLLVLSGRVTHITVAYDMMTVLVTPDDSSGKDR